MSNDVYDDAVTMNGSATRSPQPCDLVSKIKSEEPFQGALGEAQYVHGERETIPIVHPFYV